MGRPGANRQPQETENGAAEGRGLPAWQAAFVSARGPRPDNQDYVGILSPTGLEQQRRGAVFVVADGVGGLAQGRVAAELAVRIFLEGYLDLPATLGVERLAARSLEAAQRSLHGLGHGHGRTGAAAGGMATTFTALILHGRTGHLIHVGDTRLYRLRGGRLARLTTDHTYSAPGQDHILHRAVGLDTALHADHAALPLEAQDRYLLSSDGIHAFLPEAEIQAQLAARQAPAETVARLVAAALQRGGGDNATALIVDVMALPPPDQATLAEGQAGLPVLPLPAVGEVVDGYRLTAPLADSRMGRLFRAFDEEDGVERVLKFPHPRQAADPALRAAFLREAWIGGVVRHPGIAATIEPRPGRQRRLYIVQPHYPGETLASRLARQGKIPSAEATRIACAVCRAAHLLHRQGIIHRDIKPENLLLSPAGGAASGPMGGPGGGIVLLDLGVARIAAEPEAPGLPVPGTPSYMAPEMFLPGRGGDHDGRGDERSDVFAIGVTLYRCLSGGAYPYGEIEPFTHPRFPARPRPLAALAPEVPAWLGGCLDRALAPDPAARYADPIALAADLEAALAQGAPAVPARVPLYARDPLRFWQGVAGLLLLLLILCLYRLAAQP